jgi:hypothetical protein
MVSIDSIKVDSLKIDTEPIDARRFEDLQKKYDDDEFVYERTIENSGWWTRFKQWLSDFFKDLFSINSEAQASKVTDISIKIAGAIIFLLVIYFIFKAVINDEGKWIFGKSSDKNIIPVMDIETNLQATNFEQLIANAEKDGHHRLAIRYYYLWLLKVLTNAEIIDYDVEKTNSDYYNEISNKATKDDFAYTSYLYNYIWYGEFDVNEAQFQKAKEAFLNFIKSVKR